jgi:hypothetical protein
MFCPKYYSFLGIDLQSASDQPERVPEVLIWLHGLWLAPIAIQTSYILKSSRRAYLNSFLLQSRTFPKELRSPVRIAGLLFPTCGLTFDISQATSLLQGKDRQLLAPAQPTQSLRDMRCIRGGHS